MASSVEALASQEQGAARPCLCESYARVTERSALASARWLGRDDQDGATEAACAGMQESLEQLPVDGHIVIGVSEAPTGSPPGRRSAPKASLLTWRWTRSREPGSSRVAAAARCR